jgi:hypothetical protein
MQQPDYLSQIWQVLSWLLEDEQFRELFFQHPQEAFFRLEQAGYPLSSDAKRFLEKRVDKDSLEDEFQRFSSRPDVRGGALSAPSAALPADLFSPRLMGERANGGEETPPERIVSTGFSSQDRPGKPVDSRVPLLPATPYFFWFEVGEPVEGHIEEEEVPLPFEKLPPEVRLQVVVYAFENEFEISSGEDVGEIELRRDGKVVVARRAATPEHLSEPDLLAKRLFFPVRTPDAAGDHRMRCNIYFKQNLVQSRLITFRVAADSVRSDDPALISQVDFTLSKALQASLLKEMKENRLSLMLNDNGNGTHGFRFFGQDNFKNDATLQEGALTNLIDIARNALRKAAWGDREPYEVGKRYRYQGGLDKKRLSADLIRLARKGYDFYDALATQLTGAQFDLGDLERLMARPGQVELASKESARLIVPLALFYDYVLDDGSPSSDFSLCHGFEDALQGDQPLADTPCFQGDCPTREDLLVVCPSGFWGYRHCLGLPVSVKSAPDAPTQIPSPDVPKLAVSVSTDPNFVQRPNHEQTLKAMGFGWEYADSRDESLDMLKQTESQVVYFYCHGGVTPEKLPYISVGPPKGKRFTRSNLRAWRIRWREIRPLVFINGCHTTSLTPEAAIDLVSGFIQTSHAAGVMGTEITIFEPIAVAFAETFFQSFLLNRKSLGEAVREARLKMLKDGNPLGLVYIPYATPNLKIVQ